MWFICVGHLKSYNHVKKIIFHSKLIIIALSRDIPKRAGCGISPLKLELSIDLLTK